MNNANKPAYPLTEEMDATMDVAIEESKYRTGLTKRELIAAMAMQGLLANPNVTYFEDAVADEAMNAADVLIMKLKVDYKSE